MIKKFTQIAQIVLFMLIIPNVNANTWRVNNNDATAHFQQIQVAHDNAEAGDTLLVEGSNDRYSNATISKPLTIIGPGYFLSTNYSETHSLTATIQYMYFVSGSEGSRVIGMTFYRQNYSGEAPIIQTNNISVERCYSDGAIQLYYVNNIRIVNCYLPAVEERSGYSDYYYTNLYFANNIVTGNMVNHSQTMLTACNNNIFLGSSYTINANHFRNNIVVNGNASLYINSAFIENNIGTNNIFGDGNLNVDDISTLFVGGDSPDGKYELAAGSAAIGAGYEGRDCGVFGGEEPYVISGLPPLPIITEMDVEDAASADTGLKVKIKVQNNK